MDVTDTYLEQVRSDPASPSGLATVYKGQLGAGAGDPGDVPGQQRRPGRRVPPGNGIPAATLIVPRRNQGPIVQLDQSAGTALSVQYAGFSATQELDAFLVWSRPRTSTTSRRGLQSFDVGSQNWSYADRRGHIAYFTSGELPLREDLQAGHVDGIPPYLVRNGTGGNEWLPAAHHYPGQALPYEILPAAEMPHRRPAQRVRRQREQRSAGDDARQRPLDQLRPDGGICA